MNTVPIAQQMITNVAGPGFVPPTVAGLKRFPFVFVIDISGSTGAMPDPDIHHINKAIAMLLDALRNPTPSSQLQKQVDAIDIAIIAYSAQPRVIQQWSIVHNLPAALQTLSPESSTGTGAALELALSLIGERLRFYQAPANNLAYGMPHIIHLTDGAMTDMKPGDARWTAIQQSFANITGAANPENQIATLLHFVSPKGCVRDQINVNGRMMSGQDLLAELTGKDTVFEMGREIGSFEQLVRLITVAIKTITTPFGSKTGIEAMRHAIDSVADAIRTNPKTEPY